MRYLHTMVRVSDLDSALDFYCAKLGLKSIELTGPGQWPTLKKHNLICAMTPSHSIPKGFNRVENHEECIAKADELGVAMVFTGHRHFRH